MVKIQREYVAGSCNISKEEEALRLATGWLGAGLTVAAGLAFLALGVQPLWRLTLFFPAAFGASGFLQAGMHFCAGYGMKGVFNVASEVGTTAKVSQPDDAKKDKAKATTILALAVLIGAAAAVTVFFLPL